MQLERIRRARNFAAIAFLSATACETPAATPAESASPALQERFQAEVSAAYEEYGFPGITAAYILPNGDVGVAAAGFADVELQTPMQTDSRMLAASIGKTFVGATVLALVQNGMLELDKPISTWLGDEPWFSRLPNNDAITLRQLLLHTAGLPDHVYSEEYQQQFAAAREDTGTIPSPENAISYILDQDPVAEPGEAWSYSDTGYLLVGLIIEKVSEITYYDEVETRFISPLHLDLTSPSNTPVLPGLAAGYLPAENNFGLPPKTTISPGIMAWNPAGEWTGGGFASNPKDLVVWAKALYEGRAMEGDYLTDLLAAALIGGEGSGVSYGLGVGIYEDTPLGPIYGHGGGIPGYTSSMRYYPDYRVAISFQLNTDDGIADGSSPLDEIYPALQLRLAQFIIDSLAE